MNIRHSIVALGMALVVPAIASTPAFATNYPVTNPTSTYLDTATLTIPLNASEFSVPAFGPMREVPFAWDSNCPIMVGPHVYDVQSIDVTIEGDYTFRTVATSSNQVGSYPDPWHAREDEGFTGMNPIEDSFVALFAGGFDAANPYENVVGCNDDYSEYWAVVDAHDGGIEDENVDTTTAGGTWVWGTDHITVGGNRVSTKMPAFTTHLEVGHYTALITVWIPMSSDSWAAGDDGDTFQWSAGAASVQTEIWGPTAGATLSNETWDIIPADNGESSESLAPTGGDSALGFGLLSLGALVLGFFVRGRRFRKAA